MARKVTESSDWGSTWASWQAALFQGTTNTSTTARAPPLSFEEVSPEQHGSTHDRTEHSSRSSSMSTSSMVSSPQENIPLSSLIDRQAVLSRSRSAQSKSRRTRDESNPFLHSNVLVEKTSQFSRSKSVGRSAQATANAVSQTNRLPSELTRNRSRSLERKTSTQSQNQAVKGIVLPESSTRRNRSKSPFPRQNTSGLKTSTAQLTPEEGNHSSLLSAPFASAIKFGKARSEFSLLPEDSVKLAESSRLENFVAKTKEQSQQQSTSTWVKPKPMSRPVQARFSPNAKKSKNRMQQMMRSLSPRRLRGGRAKEKESSPFFGRFDKYLLGRDGNSGVGNSTLNSGTETQPQIENNPSGTETPLSMTSVLKASPSFRRSASSNRKRSDPRQITENRSMQPLVTSKLSLEDTGRLPQSLSEVSMTARDSFVLDSPVIKKNAAEREIVANQETTDMNRIGISDETTHGHVGTDQNIESEGSADSSSTAMAVKNSSSKNREEMLDHYRKLMEVYGSGNEAEATPQLQSSDQRDRSLTKKDVRQPFSLEGKQPKRDTELKRVQTIGTAILGEKSDSNQVGISWKTGFMRQFRGASSRSPRKNRKETNEKFPSDSSDQNNPSEKEIAGTSTHPPVTDNHPSTRAGTKAEAGLQKTGSKNIQKEKPVHRQQVVRNFRKFSESNGGIPIEKSKSLSSADPGGSLHSVSLQGKSEETSNTNDYTKKCYVRLTPQSLSGLRTEKIRRKSSHSNTLVHGLVAHVQEDGSIESPASIALSQPITPAVETIKISSYSLVWSNPSADSTKGRIYFSVPVDNNKKAADQEIVVGIKRGQEMIQLGYASVPVFGRAVSGLDVEIGIIPFDSKKRGIFAKRSDVFENDDKVYKLAPVAILRATLDIKYGQRRQTSCQNEGSLFSEQNSTGQQSNPEKYQGLSLNGSGDHSEAPLQMNLTEERKEKDFFEAIHLDEPSLEKESSAGKSTDLPSLDITRILSGILSWRSEQGDEQIMNARMTPAASGLMSPDPKDWYSPTYKSKKPGSTDFKAGTGPNDVASEPTGYTNLEKTEEKMRSDAGYEKLTNDETKQKRVVHEIIPVEPPAVSGNSSFTDAPSHSATLETNGDSASQSTLTNTRSADFISLSSGLGDARVLAHVMGMCAGGSAHLIDNHVGPYRIEAGRTLKLRPKEQNPEKPIDAHHESFDASDNNDSVSIRLRNTLDIEHTKKTGSGLGSEAGTFDNSAISNVTDNVEQQVEEEQESTVEDKSRDHFEEKEGKPKGEEPIDTDLVKFAMELEKARTRQTSNKVKQVVDDSHSESHPVTTSIRERPNSSQLTQTPLIGGNSINNTEEDLPFDCRESGSDVQESLDPTQLGDDQELLQMLSGFSNGSQHENQLLPPTRQSKARPRPEDRIRSLNKAAWSGNLVLKQEETAESSIISGTQVPDLPSLKGTDSGIVESPSIQNVGPSFDSRQGTDCLGGTVESVFASLFGRTEMKALSNGESRDPIIEEEEDPDDYAFQEISMASNNSHGATFSQDESFSRTFAGCHNQHGSESSNRLALVQLEQQNSDLTDFILQEPPHVRRKGNEQQQYPAIDEYVPSSDASLPLEEGFETILYNFDGLGSKKSSKRESRKDSKRRKKRLSQQRKKSKSRAPLANKRLERLRPEDNFGLRTVDGFNSPRIQSTTDTPPPVAKHTSKQRSHVTWERPPFLETSPRSEDMSALSFEFSENGTTRRITDILDQLSTSPHNQDSTASPSNDRETSSNVSYSWSQEEDDENDDQPMNQRKNEEYAKATERLLQLSQKLGVSPEALLNQLDTP